MVKNQDNTNNIARHGGALDNYSVTHAFCRLDHLTQHMHRTPAPRASYIDRHHRESHKFVSLSTGSHLDQEKG